MPVSTKRLMGGDYSTLITTKENLMTDLQLLLILFAVCFLAWICVQVRMQNFNIKMNAKHLAESQKELALRYAQFDFQVTKERPDWKNPLSIPTQTPN